MAKTVPHPIVKAPSPCQRSVMNESMAVSLLPEEKLDALRYLDEFRFWYSLDDQRRCQRCHRVLTGRQIQVLKRKGTRDGMLLRCPTAGCDSTSNEWVYVDPIEAASKKTPSTGLAVLPHRTQEASPVQKRRREASRAKGRRRFVLLRTALTEVAKSTLLNNHTIPPAPDPIGP